jgi:IS5 family transposase
MYNFVASPIKFIDSSNSELMERLVKEDHPFRVLNNSLKLDKLAREYRHLYAHDGAKGIAIEKAFRCLVIQWLEDYSDREMERALQENVAVKWFCGFEMTDKTPDHSFFGQFRKRFGTTNLGQIFQKINDNLRDKGLISDSFHFIDGSGIVTKTALWEERDKALEAGEEKLNNLNVKKYASDSQARYGCKGKNKFWYGYKRHHCVDMKQGMVTKVAVTPANVNEDEAFKHIAPRQGLAYMDKQYATQEVERQAKLKGCQARAIKKNNQKNKNHDFDHYVSRMRMPYEGTFSKLNKRARYRTLVKVQFQGFAQALAHNLKRLISVETSLATT